MSSLRADFDELMRRVDSGREFTHASYEPIFYLVFHPRDILEIKRLMPAWTARLRNDNWQVEVFSIADQVAEIFSAAPMRNIWLAADRKNPLDWVKTNQSLANALTANPHFSYRVGFRAAVAPATGSSMNRVVVAR